MAEKIKKSKISFLSLAKTVKPEEKIMAARKALLDMKEKLLREGLGKSLRGGLVRPLISGMKGIGPTLSEPTKFPCFCRFGIRKSCWQSKKPWKSSGRDLRVCEECGDEIGAGRLKAMTLARLCVPVNRDWKRKRPIRNSPKGSLTKP